MSNHGITDRVDRLTESAKGRVAASRRDKLDKDNERLRAEVKLLRDDLQEERASSKQMAKGLKQRRPRILRTMVIAGGAYLLGCKAGRERYEQIVSKVGSALRSVRESVRDDRSDVWNMAEPDNVAPSTPVQTSTGGSS
jgi:hypothetical protein